MSIDLTMCFSVIGQLLLFLCEKEKRRCEISNMEGEKAANSETLIDLDPPPPSQTHPPSTHFHAIYFPLVLSPPGPVLFLTSQRLVIKIEIFTT